MRRIDVKLAVIVMHAHQITFLDPQHPGEPFRNHNLQKFALNLGDAARTINQLRATVRQGDQQNHFALDLQHRAFQ
jgi:hypothetical protein